MPRLCVKGGTYPWEGSRFAMIDYQTCIVQVYICVHDDISTWYVANLHMHSVDSITEDGHTCS